MKILGSDLHIEFSEMLDCSIPERTIEALKEPRSMVITEKIAQKYFGRTEVTGQYLTINDTASYRITGVIRNVPSNTHFNFDFFLPFTEISWSRDDNWLSQNFNTYLLLKENASAKKLQQDVDALLSRFIGPVLKDALGISLEEFTKQGSYVKCTLTPLTDIHLHSNKIGELEGNGTIQYVYIFSLVAFFILIIACVNFMNLFTARSSNRAKEVGVRKVLGSLRKNLVWQFLAESMLISFMALLIALLITWPVLPYFNQLAGKEVRLSVLFQPAMILFLLLFTIIVGLLAGSYPALVLSAFQPIAVLKGLAKGFKGSWLRNALVVFQFAVSIILMVGTIIIYSQLDFIRTKDIGFNRHQVMVIRNTEALKTQINSFRNELLQLSGVTNITTTGYLPLNGDRNGNAFFTSPTLDPKTAIAMQAWYVDENYIPTLSIQMLQGRNFSPQFPTDSTGIILNEAAVKFLSTKELLNKKLYVLSDIKNKALEEYHVIGIIKNFHFNSMRDAITPLALFIGKEKSSIALRVEMATIGPLLQQIKNKWQSAAPGQPFDYAFLDEEFNRLYHTEERTGQIFITFSVLAIVIACLGLFALVAYAAEQRIKEIGIRKVLGASVMHIVSMLSMDFLKLVAIAALVSFPIAWWAMHQWLQGFAYRIRIHWGVFALAGVAALLIALITVSFQAIKAAVANPVKSLRTE